MSSCGWSSGVCSSDLVPTVVLDVAKRLVISQKPGATGSSVFYLGKSTIPVALAKVGPGLGKNVGVDIDLECRVCVSHGGCYLPAGGTSMTVPHDLPVRKVSSA